ncbi:hypothetical protein Sjap_021842 [Stephania japonica]|uniref:Uncharacterized protein n=1 Tax=Stephania japonica TaxID=461633 RepID=A0AAP0HUH5_9MAGN
MRRKILKSRGVDMVSLQSPQTHPCASAILSAPRVRVPPPTRSATSPTGPTLSPRSLMRLSFLPHTVSHVGLPVAELPFNSPRTKHASLFHHQLPLIGLGKWVALTNKIKNV